MSPSLLGFARAGALVLCLSLAPSLALAQAALINGLGGTADYGTACLGRNDDGHSTSIDLRPIFPSGIQFFDQTHTSMFVNTNGNVTFSAGLPTYTPNAFPVADRPMIAPFWADVDIRGTECREPDGGTGVTGACQNPASNGVWWHLDTVGRRVVVTWDRVGYYRCHVDRVMSFQLVLSPAPTSSCAAGGGGDFDVEFRFNRCEWNTGDASGGQNGLPRTAACTRPLPIFPATCPIGNLPCTGGSPGSCTGVAAQSGFDAGNTRDFVEIMGSRTPTIHTTLCTMSNVGEPGVWRFQIRRGAVICPDAGAECDTGMQGVCATGRTQCVGGGTECRPEVMSSPERCDALDNDCDGSVDEGDGLCGLGEVCDRGVCVGVCFEGGCAEGQTCASSGRCVDTGCESLSCPEGQRCVAGACVGACDGVRCPAGTDCRGGRCVDLCAGAVCDDCTVCQGGACIARCQFQPCPGGQSCLEDGRCVEASCASVTCPAGTVCRGGSCEDACAGATCPRGEACVMGECVYVPPMERDAGVPPPVDGGGPMPGEDAGITPSPDAGPLPFDGGFPRPPSSSPGCACELAPRASGAPWALGLGLLLALTVRRRRR
ncbi:MAG: hypothetical protein KF729_21600 [Sandaracinaceae bacterium]|nr:hypothetical protein [Sandaracinaceae bacterium]